MLKLIQTDNGVFAAVFDDPALNDADAAAATLVYAFLYTDAEAPARRVADRYERRGWWANSAAGSPLWYVRRQPLGTAARSEALEMVRTGLESSSPALSDIAITEVTPSEGNVSSVVLEVTGSHNGRKFIVSVPL